jgi:hypothetical protein
VRPFPRSTGVLSLLLVLVACTAQDARPDRAGNQRISPLAQERVWQSLPAACQSAIGAERWVRESSANQLDDTRTRVALGSQDWLVRRDPAGTLEVLQGERTREWVDVGCPEG